MQTTNVFLDRCFAREEAGDHAHGLQERHPRCGRGRTVVVVGVAADPARSFADAARHAHGRGTGDLDKGGFVWRT
eukprot:8050228-Pyramimonas_sp.AAC.1